MLFRSAAKSEVHGLYAERSAIERASQGRLRTGAEQSRINELNARMKPIYDAAFAFSTNAKNLASETGAPLRRAESAENSRGSDLSQAAQENGTPGTLPSETGMPSTSKNSTLAENSGVFTDKTSSPSMPKSDAVVNSSTPRDYFDATNIVAERPDLLIPGENGEMVSAAQALAQADAEISIAKRESQGYDAAVACALRG